MVRAKFVCVQNDPNVGIILNVVNDGSEENKSFFKYTPGGQVVLHILNPAAAEQFEVGKEYYVDFTVCDAAVNNG